MKTNVPRKGLMKSTKNAAKRSTGVGKKLTEKRLIQSIANGIGLNVDYPLTGQEQDTPSELTARIDRLEKEINEHNKILKSLKYILQDITRQWQTPQA